MWPRERAKYLSSFVDNKLGDCRQDTLAQLTDINPTIDVSSAVGEYQQQAKIINDVIHAEWSRRNMGMSLIQLVDHSLFGRGFWKLGAVSPGKLITTACGMDTVLPIQCNGDIQESSAVLYRTLKPPSYFKNIWGARADGIENQSSANMLATTGTNTFQRPGNMSEYTWNSLSPSMRRAMGSRVSLNPAANEVQTFPAVELQEFWVDDFETNNSQHDVLVKNPYISEALHNYHYVVKPGQRLWPRKRLIVFAGDRIMYDGPSPYWHGRFPFAELSLNPVVWAPGGASKYRPLVPLNKAINDIGAGTLDNIKKALNQTVITRKGAINDADWEKYYPNRPGSKLRMNPNANPTADLRFSGAVDLPGYVFQFLSQYLQPRFDKAAGILDVSSLTKKKQVPGGDAIEAIRDSQTSQFRLESKFIANMLTKAGEQAVSNIIQYFDRSTRMRMLGADGQTWNDFDYKAGSLAPAMGDEYAHWTNFALRISEGSLDGRSKDRDKTLAAQLYKLGAISLQELHRKLGISNSQQILKEMSEEAQMGLHGSGGGKSSGGRTPRATRGQRNGKDV